MFKAIDFYGHEVKLNVEGKTTSQTYLGAMASILSIVVLLFYFNLRFDVLMNYKDTTYHSTTKPNPDVNNELNMADANFNFAFGLQSIDVRE